MSDVNARENEILTKDTKQWHRLNPLAVIHYLVIIVKNILNQGLNALPALIAFVAFSRDYLLVGIFIFFALFIMFGGGFAILSYVRFRFRLADKKVMVKKGVIFRKRLTLDYDRVQSINIAEPLYFRPFNLAVLKLDSAGSYKSEVRLSGIPKSLAQSIRSELLDYQKAQALEKGERHENARIAGNTENGENAEHAKYREHAGATASSSYRQMEAQATGGFACDNDASSHSAGEILISRSVFHLVKYGLSNNGIWIFAGLLSSIIGGNANNFEALITPSVANFLEQVQQSGPLGVAAAIFIVLIVILFLMLGVSILVAIIQFYAFKLTRDGDRLVRTNGLFELKESSLKESKIQALRLSQNFMAKLLNIRHLSIRQAGSFNNMLQPANNFLVPSLSPGMEENGLIEKLYTGFKPQSLQFRQINKRFISRSFGLFLLAPVAMITLILMAFLHFLFAILLVVPFIFYPLFVLRHKRYGYALDRTFAAVKTGLFGQSVTYIEARKVQFIKLGQSPSQRRHRLATLTLYYAGTSLTIPYMPLEDARIMFDYLLMKSESNRQPWM